MLKSRSLMFLASSLWAATILIVLVFRGGSAVPVSVEPHPTSDQSSLAHRAELLANAGDYEGAWGLYYQALQVAPEEGSLWYRLGVVLSHLNRRSEAVEAFQYVLRRGRPDSEEVRVARRWLVSAGVPVEPVAFAAVTADPVIDARGDRAAVQGKVTWGAPAPARPVRIQLLLAGLNGAAEGTRFNTRAVLGGSYRFEGLPAGAYRLIGAAEGQRLWDLTLAVEDGKEVVLDLGRDSSSTPTVTLSP
jgi:tetratricopeptide (TPR) repeat protein